MLKNAKSRGAAFKNLSGIPHQGWVWHITSCRKNFQFCKLLKYLFFLKVSSMWFLALIAFASFSGELALHIASFIAVDPLDWVQPVWVFPVVSLGLLFLLACLSHLVGRDCARSTFPLWFKPIICGFALYAIFSFFRMTFVEARGGDPTRLSPNAYALVPGHGRPPTPITEAEYHHRHRLEARRGSAFYMALFLALGADLFFTWKNPEISDGDRRGWNGVVITLITRRKL